MPRNHNPGTASLRNRNRITNKTRLKIVRGAVDADPLLLDEEAFVSNSVQTAGVDAEETNEHHLQAVLSAASKQASQRSRSGEKAADKVAYIPVPKANGLADNYEELYPAGRWRDPATYLATSATVEESCSGALSDGFTYYMDERDKEWLDKNNEEARGEGTSTQGAVSASASGATRVSARSAKAKGKEPESPQPVAIPEDLFELIMGLFEKVTHEKTEHLHLSLNTGMQFPAFTDYQDVFASSLPPSYFATFSVPQGIPPPPAIMRAARLIYPHWRERRLDRGGLRIIPVLNADEADTLNESYVCFRRREIKAARKTRASQASSSDKLARLQAELAYPLEMAKALLTREMIKKDSIHQAQAVWEKRMALVNLKRKFPVLGDRADEELLYDKERVAKKPKVEHRLKLRPNDPASPAVPSEAAIRPSQRAAAIQTQIDRELTKQKECDHHWEDSVDNAYQPLPVPFASRAFKFISTDPSTTNPDRQPRALRHRLGRGGRTWVDRRNRGPPLRLSGTPTPSLLGLKRRRSSETDSADEDDEQRLLSQWRFDDDDCPPIGPNGIDEMDRVLVDDYAASHIRSTMKLFSDSDLNMLTTDNTLTITHPDGRQQSIVPYRLGLSGVSQVRREPPRPPNGAVPPHVMPSPTVGSPSVASPIINGTPNLVASVPASATLVNGTIPLPQVKKLTLNNTSTPMIHHANGIIRSPSVVNGSGAMRPPLSTGSSPVVSSMLSNVPSSQLSPPHAHPVIQHPSSTAVNGVNRGAINMPHIDMSKADIHLTPTGNALINVQPATKQSAGSPEPFPSDANVTTNGTSPTRPPTQNQQPPNGLHTKGGALTNGVSTTGAVYTVNGTTGNVLSHQQRQDLKSAFANSTDLALSQVVNGAVGGRASVGVPYVQVPNGATFNVQLGMNQKLAAARHIPWSTSLLQRGANGIDATPHVNGVVHGTLASTPLPSHSPPVRSPSRTGTATGMRAPSVGVVGHASPNRVSQSPHLHHASPPLNHSSPLPLSTTLPTMPSPSIQHVG